MAGSSTSRARTTSALRVLPPRRFGSGTTTRWRPMSWRSCVPSGRRSSSPCSARTAAMQTANSRPAPFSRARCSTPRRTRYASRRRAMACRGRRLPYTSPAPESPSTPATTTRRSAERTPSLRRRAVRSFARSVSRCHRGNHVPLRRGAESRRADWGPTVLRRPSSPASTRASYDCRQNFRWRIPRSVVRW